METTETTTRSRAARSRSAVRTVLAGLALAGALVAVPATHPQDASAMRRMSERTARHACFQAGGHILYNFGTGGFDNFQMSCDLPSGESFECFSVPSSIIVNCG